MKLNDHYSDFIREVFKEVGLDPEKFTPEQLEIIQIPMNSPEEYYQDGEISPLTAKHLHNDKLCRANINGTDRVKALRLCD
jgi:hypothetical protein